MQLYLCQMNLGRVVATLLDTADFWRRSVLVWIRSETTCTSEAVRTACSALELENDCKKLRTAAPALPPSLPTKPAPRGIATCTLRLLFLLKGRPTPEVRSLR